MKQIGILFRLSAMRCRTGSGLPTSLRWAIGLLWRNHLTARRRRHLERRTEIERAARQHF